MVEQVIVLLSIKFEYEHILRSLRAASENSVIYMYVHYYLWNTDGTVTVTVVGADHEL